MTARVYADERNYQAVIDLLKRLEARGLDAVTFASAQEAERLLLRAPLRVRVCESRFRDSQEHVFDPRMSDGTDTHDAASEALCRPQVRVDDNELRRVATTELYASLRPPRPDTIRLRSR